MERVQKIIAASGLCSRRKAEELIEAGRVQVNGVTIALGDQANRETDTITVDGTILELPKLVYYMLHKPKDYVTTNDDPHAKKKVVDLVPKKPRVFAVGRLDKDATGLLIMTNDGDYAQSIAHPSHEVAKTYIAVLKDPWTKQMEKELTFGVDIDGKRMSASAIQLDKKTIAITVEVGMHKIVKRLIKGVGNYVKHLHRTHIGNLALDVPEGEFRELDANERKLATMHPRISAKTFLNL